MMSPMLALTFALSIGAAPTPQSETKRPTPRAWVQSKVDAAQKLADRPVDNDAQSEAWKKDATEMVEQTVAWSRMTEETLGYRWKKLDAKQREAFSDVLKKLIQASYRSKLQLALQKKDGRDRKLKITYEDTRLDGDEAELDAWVRAGRDEVALTFRLQWTDGEWRMWDLVTNEAGTVEIYRGQFRKIISSNGGIGGGGLDALLRKLEAKLADIEAGRGEFIPGQ